MIRAYTAGGAIALLAILLQPRPVAAQSTAAGDPAAGHKIAQHVCGVCHGVNGIAKQPDAANLAGQNPDYLVRQLTAFHSGDRKNETMGMVAQMLNDQQMRDVAAYYGSIKVSVTSVPGQ